ncbi:anthranilate synthase component I family protein [Burkholderia gladioli]|uniref:anthranilate synthase component I family protein n=1 Tax=Burkholderia gladioli TaxID=28095 RepID=UPI001ABACE7B|nr:anthranilate synthase component I family protein [Burkholderia gladioli]
MAFRCLARRRALNVDSADVYQALYAGSAHSYWLDSRRVEAVKGRFSFMGDDQGPHAFVVSQRVDESPELDREMRSAAPLGVDIFASLAAGLDACALADTRDDLPFDFRGGYVGFFGYELMALTEGVRGQRSALPDAQFLFSDRFIAFDHINQDIYLVALELTHEDSAESWFDSIETKLAAIRPRTAPSPAPLVDREALVPYLLDDRECYLAKIAHCQDKIAAGESYEICLTSRLRVPLDDEASVDPIELYLLLRETNPAPYACLIRTPDFSVLCSSPERFLKIDRHRVVEARPIKGTTPRDADPAIDEHNRQHLARDQRYFSENLMIVDLLRNDLTRSCEPGTIKVPELMVVESYATVHQLVSSIRGELRDSPIECIARCFPGGSMTGAPKHRTLEILAELEDTPRGIYSGAIGYLSANATVDMNIVIRTIVLVRDSVEIGVGGAITFQSDPEEEYEEMRLKAVAPFSALRSHLDSKRARL